MQARLNAARVVCIGSLLLLGACGGGGGAGGAGAPVADLTGSWSVTESGVSDCAGQASYTFGPAQITITQSGNDLAVVGPAGTFSGSIDGDRAGWSGSYPSGDGTTTITSMALTVAADGSAFSGSANWSWTNGRSSCSGTSQSINATRVPAGEPVPQAPDALSATPRSASSVDLVWNDNSDNESGFKLERRVSGDPAVSYAHVALLPADVTAHTDGGLNALTAYDYRVRAYNSGGDSEFSNVFTVTTLAPPPPAPLLPSDLQLTVNSASSITLRWVDNSTIETAFRIERSTSASGGFTQIASVGRNVTSFVDIDLESATEYFYRVRASNAGGTSAYSNIAAATTLPPIVAPAAPANLTARALSNSAIELSWSDQSDNETGFKIERSTSPNEGFTQIATTAAGVAQFGDGGLSPFTRYYYRVRATNEAGDSGYSNTASAMTFIFDF